MCEGCCESLVRALKGLHAKFEGKILFHISARTVSISVRKSKFASVFPRDIFTITVCLGDFREFPIK